MTSFINKMFKQFNFGVQNGHLLWLRHTTHYGVRKTNFILFALMRKLSIMCYSLFLIQFVLWFLSIKESRSMQNNDFFCSLITISKIDFITKFAIYNPKLNIIFQNKQK